MLADQRPHGMADQMNGAAGDVADDIADRLHKTADRQRAERRRRAPGPRQIGPHAAKAAERAEQHLERVRCAAKAVHEQNRRPFAVDLDHHASEDGASHERISRNSFCSMPMPAISIRATSPGTTYYGGLNPMPTPAGVPLAIMS